MQPNNEFLKKGDIVRFIKRGRYNETDDYFGAIGQIGRVTQVRDIIGVNGGELYGIMVEPFNVKPSQANIFPVNADRVEKL